MGAHPGGDYDPGGADAITRNSYGAPCLNTPDVMIVDVDEEDLVSLTNTFGLGQWWAGMVAIASVFIVLVAWINFEGVRGASITGAVCWIAFTVGAHALATHLRPRWLRKIGGDAGWLKNI